MKKKNLIIILVVVFILMLIPIPLKLKDGGSIEYKALLYNVTKIHKLNNQSSTGYEDGWKIEILGIQIYNEVDVNIKNKFEIGEKSNIEILDKQTSMSIKENTLTRSSVILILKNNHNENVQYDDYYEIEIKKDGNWHKINVELLFNQPLHKLKPNESKEIEIDWERGYGILANGEYRIIKNVGVVEDNKTLDSYKLAVEFNIK